MAKHSIASAHMVIALAHLADAARTSMESSPYTCARVCDAVADLIVGTEAGGARMRMFEAVEIAGFTPEFYGSSARVHWEGI